jgi:hypothetical protein
LSAPPDNTTIHAALYDSTTGRPSRPLIETLFQSISSAIASTVSSVAWGGITGTLSSQADLQSALNGKAATTHTHTLSSITNAGTAAALNTPASGDAATNQVALGSDSRFTNARTPLAHTHPQSDITNLAADVASAKIDAINVQIDAPAAGTYVLEEYAEAAGAVNRVTDRLTSGSATYRLQLGGVDIGGLGTSASPLNPTSTQAQRSATSANTYAVGTRLQLLVTAVTSPGSLILSVKRTKA